MYLTDIFLLLLCAGVRAICLIEHARWNTLREAIHAGLPLVHLLRDPVEVITFVLCTRGL